MKTIFVSEWRRTSKVPLLEVDPTVKVVSISKLKRISMERTVSAIYVSELERTRI